MKNKTITVDLDKLESMKGLSETDMLFLLSLIKHGTQWNKSVNRECYCIEYGEDEEKIVFVNSLVTKSVMTDMDWKVKGSVENRLVKLKKEKYICSCSRGVYAVKCDAIKINRV